MGRYSASARKPETAAKDLKPHPIWRGIGFMFLLIAPVMGYFGTRLIIQLNSQNRWFPIPSGLINRGGLEFLGAIGRDPMLYVYIIFTIVLTLLFYAILQMISFILYGIFGPKRYGLYDVPPTKLKRPSKSR